VVIGAQVVASCGSQSLAVSPAVATIDQTGKLCVNANVSSTISGTITTSPAGVTPVTQVTSPWIVACSSGCSGGSSGITSGIVSAYILAPLGSLPVTQGVAVSLDQTDAAVLAGPPVTLVVSSATTSTYAVGSKPPWPSDTYGIPYVDVASITSGTVATSPTVITPVSGSINRTSDYPVGATPISASTSGTVSAFTVTLLGAPSQYTYLCGFSVRDNATAATTSAANITGIVSGTLYYLIWTAPLASGLGVSEELYQHCRPSSATSTNIVLTIPAPGSGGLATVDVWGYLKATYP